MGKKVAPSFISIFNDPFDERGVFSTPFDSKGSPACIQPLVKEGILTGLLHNARTREEMGSIGTTNEERYSYNYPADIYPTNFRLEAVEAAGGDLLSRLEEGLLITELSAYFPGHGINQFTGDYSIPALGFVVRGGRVGEAVTCTIAGNLSEFLADIQGAGADVEYGLPSSFYQGGPTWYGCYASPSLLVENISVAGA